MSELGKVNELNLREEWRNEEKDFTPWLSENLELLEDIIELDLELKGTEISVGSYKADIVAESTQIETGDVVIENQLGKSDHDHLGKVITYASGLDASYIIWVCEKVREEHKAAVDWLNQNLEKEVGVIALEIKLIQIGDSKPAPQFKVISKPEEWSKYVKSAASAEITETKQMQREFWSGLKEYMKEKGTFLNPRKPRAQHWYSFAIGHKDFKISLIINTRDKKARCELYIMNKGTERLKELKKYKEEIEENLKGDVGWQPLEDKKASRIVQYKDFNLMEDEWEETFEWFKGKAEKFYEVFKPKVQNI